MGSGGNARGVRVFRDGNGCGNGIGGMLSYAMITGSC